MKRAILALVITVVAAGLQACWDDEKENENLVPDTNTEKQGRAPVVIPPAETVTTNTEKQGKEKVDVDTTPDKTETLLGKYETVSRQYARILKVPAYSDGKGGVAPEKFARSEQAVIVLKTFTAFGRTIASLMKDREDDEAKAFWINYFNAVILQSEVQLLRDDKKKEIPNIIAEKEPQRIWKMTAEAFRRAAEPWYLFALHTGRAGDPSVRSELYSGKEKEFDTQLMQQAKAFLASPANVKCEEPGLLKKSTLTLAPFFYENAEELGWDPAEIDEKDTPAGAGEDTRNFFRFLAAYSPKATQACLVQLANAIHGGKGRDTRVKKGKGG